MRSRIPHVMVASLVALALAGAGCGGGGDDEGSTSTPAATGGGDTAAGKQIFSDNCSGCHTLSDAGSTGNVGPNLDDLQPDQATVEEQVTNGGGAMPAFKDKLSEQQITDVATYVSSVAGQ